MALCQEGRCGCSIPEDTPGNGPATPMSIASSIAPSRNHVLKVGPGELPKIGRLNFTPSYCANNEMFETI
jgi:hypothetical protein